LSLYVGEENFIELDINSGISISEEGEDIFLNILINKELSKLKTQLITSEILGKAIISKQRYENFDGSPLILDNDYFGNQRNKKNPFP
jgi:alpha-L-arabinofuranosidase